MTVQGQPSKRCASKQYEANKKTGFDPRRGPISDHKLQPGERESKAKQRRKVAHLSRLPQKTMVGRHMSSVQNGRGCLKIARHVINAIAQTVAQSLAVTD